MYQALATQELTPNLAIDRRKGYLKQSVDDIYPRERKTMERKVLVALCSEIRAHCNPRITLKFSKKVEYIQAIKRR